MNNSDESGHSCLVSDIRGNAFNLSPLSMMLNSGSDIYSLYYFEVSSFSACFLKSFNHKWVLNFVKGFYCIYWDDHMVFIFQLLTWCITLIDFHTLKNPCIPGINQTWSWCISFLMCCWMLFAKILLRIFANMFISDIGLEFSFFVFFGFGIRVMVHS